jgi:replicative superfamily II helicase
MFRGLFIGIDRYRSPVTRLSCARADALALSSLFEDTVGGEVATLVDDSATAEAIREELESLHATDPDDFAVVSFSGHGTEDHRLVPVDVDPGDIAGSCLSLDELAHLLDAIPAKQLLVFLDCCFSGGFGGGRVFAPHSIRAPVEDRSAVKALVKGDGRIVITASNAGEPALETMGLGHGLFTYYLLKGLQGAQGLAADGRIPLLDLASFTMGQVREAAVRLGETQTPTLYGSIEGAPALAVLTPGKRYAAAFPGRVRAPATAEWSSLKPYGFPAEILEAWANAMPTINELQQQAINNFGALDQQSVLVVAPTGSGKTMIGEMAAIRATITGGRSLLLLPLRALVNDKFDYMTRLYGDHLAVVRATGEHSDQVGAILTGQYDVALLTYEKFLSLMLGNPEVMRGVSVVIVDEVQTISDPTRGPSLEFLLTLLRSGHGRGAGLQVVALSAVIGDTHGLERWLGGGLLESTTRPVPLRESVIDATGGRRTLEPDGSESYDERFVTPAIVAGSQSNKPFIIPLVTRLVREGKKVIVFRSTRGDTVGAARYLANALGLPPESAAIANLPAADRSSSSDDLRAVLQHGVGFHNSDLDRDERQTLEESFRDRNSPLRVLVATPTLAMGINTPAESIVVAGLTHYGSGPYSVAEYKNMAGRAGRLGHTEAGEAFIIATADLGPTVAWERYVKGQPESVTSHFLAQATDPQTLILRCLVALGASVTEEDLVELLENSFALWHRREQGEPGWDRAALAHDLHDMIAAQLVDREPDGHLTLTELGRYAGESGIEVRSVTRVASALRAAPAVVSIPDLIVLAQVTCEMDDVRLPVNSKSHKEQARWRNYLSNEGADVSLVRMLHVGGGDPVLRAKRASASLLFMSQHPFAELEAHLLQHTRERSAAGPIRQVAARTRDVIDAVAHIVQYHGHQISESWEPIDVSVQLELGLPAALIELGRRLGNLLSRGEYLALLRSGLASASAIEAAEDSALEAAVGVASTRRIRTALAAT